MSFASGGQPVEYSAEELGFSQKMDWWAFSHEENSYLYHPTKVNLHPIVFQAVLCREVWAWIAIHQIVYPVFAIETAGCSDPESLGKGSDVVSWKKEMLLYTSKTLETKTGKLILIKIFWKQSKWLDLPWIEDCKTKGSEAQFLVVSQLCLPDLKMVSSAMFMYCAFMFCNDRYFPSRGGKQLNSSTILGLLLEVMPHFSLTLIWPVLDQRRGVFPILASTLVVLSGYPCLLNMSILWMA